MSNVVSLRPKISWGLKANLTQTEWEKVGHDLCKSQDSLQWQLGDWWCYGEDHKYGSRKALVESDDWPGPSFQVCADLGTVSRAFPATSRRHELSYSLHREVAALTPKEAQQLLSWCVEKKASVRKLREEIQRRREVGIITPRNVGISGETNRKVLPIEIKEMMSEFRREMREEEEDTEEHHPSRDILTAYGFLSDKLKNLTPAKIKLLKLDTLNKADIQILWNDVVTVKKGLTQLNAVIEAIAKRMRVI